jgi:hypothetical protein
VDLFLAVRVLYEFQSCGFIAVSSNNRVMRADKYPMTSFANFVEIGAQGVVAFLVGFYVLQELRQIISDGPVHYFSSFWNWIDVINLLLFAAVAFLRITSTFQLQAELLTATAAQLKSSVIQNLSFTIDLEKNLIAFNCVLMWVKILKYVSAHRRFNKISRTIKYSISDLLVWALIFAVSVYGFSVGGTLLLGMEDSNYRDLFKSFQTLVNAAFGDLRFQDLYRANGVMGPLYMLLWIVYVCSRPRLLSLHSSHTCSHAGLLLLNMVISIISEGLCEILDNDEKDAGAPRYSPCQRSTPQRASLLSMCCDLTHSCAACSITWSAPRLNSRPQVLAAQCSLLTYF